MRDGRERKKDTLTYLRSESRTGKLARAVGVTSTAPRLVRQRVGTTWTPDLGTRAEPASLLRPLGACHSDPNRVCTRGRNMHRSLGTGKMSISMCVLSLPLDPFVCLRLPTCTPERPRQRPPLRASTRRASRKTEGPRARTRASAYINPDKRQQSVACSSIPLGRNAHSSRNGCSSLEQPRSTTGSDGPLPADSGLECNARPQSPRIDDLYPKTSPGAMSEFACLGILVPKDTPGLCRTSPSETRSEK
ncbi:hypothetical protein FA95DRAFT_1115921 [Auriscalpium vulgare]|uniref:Uncharacterized protein n=1 Tax=Auriscalpium vulgare TaxID=40419 RepID=A0ACB8RVP7_9AGAM|nr:hypothetical protein FA95DRAFT_1115921 [Auriscalpium vulgare]